MAATQIILFSILCLVNLARADELFRSFQIQHNKTYSSNSEMVLREQIFNRNLKKIEEHNKKYQQGLVSYEMGINQFTDLTEEEFALRFGTLQLEDDQLPKNAKFQDSSKMDLNALPQSINWTEKGIVTPVKTQGLCGSGWAFSTTGALEGQLALQSGKLISLSEQQLIDCDTYNMGCSGGVVPYAVNYVTRNGLTTEDAYNYTGWVGTCKPREEVAVRTSGYVMIYPYSEEELKVAVGLIGPVSVAADARSMQYYSRGIYSGERASEVNHGVLVVGYGIDNKTLTEYWIIKNSWGSEWGENGYYRVAMGRGFFGIATYPILSSGTSNQQYLNGFLVMLSIFQLLRISL